MKVRKKRDADIDVVISEICKRLEGSRRFATVENIPGKGIKLKGLRGIEYTLLEPKDKWLLITCENNDILVPDEYTSYEDAFNAMQKAYDEMPDDGTDKHIHKEYANYQDTVTNIDWRIVCVPFA